MFLRENLSKIGGAKECKLIKIMLNMKDVLWTNKEMIKKQNIILINKKDMKVGLKMIIHMEQGSFLSWINKIKRIKSQ